MIYVLDTNILLNDANSIYTFSQNKENKIILPETVLDELDKFKSGFEEINFQARAFGRILETLNVDDSSVEKTESSITVNAYSDKLNIDIVSLNNYKCQNEDRSIINDRKIIEVALYIKENTNEEVKFISNDIMCRSRALSQGLDVSFVRDNDDSEYIFNFEIPIDIPTRNMFTLETITDKDVPTEASLFKLVDESSGQPFFFYRSSHKNITQIDENALKKQSLSPKNLEQKAFASMILDDCIDIVYCSGQAGTGKNATATSSAMRLLDKQDKYKGITYIRKTIISDDKQGDLGLLPGTLEEKMSGFLSPLNDTVEAIVKERFKTKDLTQEEIDEKIADLFEKYNIQSAYLGHQRGATIRDCVLVLDEVQNFSSKELQLLFSRVGDNVKVIVMGSAKQIDNPFLNKWNNGLSYLKTHLKKNTEVINIKGIELTHVLRSRVAEWADDEFIA